MSRSNLAQHAEEMLYADESLECGGLGNGKRNQLDGTSVSCPSRDPTTTRWGQSSCDAW